VYFQFFRVFRWDPAFFLEILAKIWLYFGPNNIRIQKKNLTPSPYEIFLRKGGNRPLVHPGTLSVISRLFLGLFRSNLHQYACRPQVGSVGPTRARSRSTRPGRAGPKKFPITCKTTLYDSQAEIQTFFFHFPPLPMKFPLEWPL